MTDFSTRDVRDATNKAERCDDLSPTFNALHIADRVTLADALVRENMKDRVDNDKLPQVIFQFGGDDDHNMHLLHGWCVGDPAAIFFREVKDIYRLPGGIDILFRDDWRMDADTLDERIRLSK